MPPVKAGPVAVLALLLLGAALPMAAASGQAAPDMKPVALRVTVVPQTLPADSNSYPALVISLLTSGGSPTLSLSDVLVYLSSSNESAAAVPPTVTLLAGHAFVQVDVTTSRSPGATIITAASSGLASKSVTINTVVPASGAHSLALFVSPAESLRALKGDDVVYAVQLVGSSGRPAVSSGTTDVVITSSNGSLVGKPINIAIAGGSNVAYGQIMTNSSGSTTLTALAPQLVTATAQLKIAPVPSALALTVVPSGISVGAHSAIALTDQLLGMPVPGANVTLSVNGGTIVPTLLVTGPTGQASATYISDAPGAFIISASAIDARLGLNLTGSSVVVVTQPVPQSTPSPISEFLSTYLPVIVVAVVAVVIVLLVRRATRKRKGAVEEDEPFPVSAPAQPK